MLFDPILDSAIYDEDAILMQPGSTQPMICAHCYKPIKGKYFQSGENFYDMYCWQFKFVIDPLFIQRASKRDKKDDKNDNDY